MITGGRDYYFLQFSEGDMACKGGVWNPGFKTTLRDIATFAIQLASTSFRGIGSFHPSTAGNGGPDVSTDAPSVGPLLRLGAWIELEDAGPYRTSRDAYMAAINHRLLQIENGAIGDPSIWGPAYVSLLDVHDLVMGCDEFAVEGPIYITHGDQKGDIFLVRPDDTVAAFIDWEL
jgi:hypothetical protein